jgi:HNH endonuclease
VKRPAMGQRARRRIRAGGPRATGRPAASLDDWASIKDLVLARAGWRCQACGLRRPLDVHHVLKRSQGGSDFDLDHLVALCRACHARTDAAYATGRLVVTALGAGRFAVEVIEGASKWDMTERRFSAVGPGAHACPRGEGKGQVCPRGQSRAATVGGAGPVRG